MAGSGENMGLSCALLGSPLGESAACTLRGVRGLLAAEKLSEARLLEPVARRLGGSCGCGAKGSLVSVCTRCKGTRCRGWGCWCGWRGGSGAPAGGCGATKKLEWSVCVLCL